MGSVKKCFYDRPAKEKLFLHDWVCWGSNSDGQLDGVVSYERRDKLTGLIRDLSCWNFLFARPARRAWWRPTTHGRRRLLQSAPQAGGEGQAVLSWGEHESHGARAAR